MQKLIETKNILREIEMLYSYVQKNYEKFGLIAQIGCILS